VVMEYEIQVFRTHLESMLGVDDVNEGKFAVVKDDRIDGPFDTYGQALEKAYGLHGLDPFLVKKIERSETVFHFTRSLN
jgi:hypothetical protein